MSDETTELRKEIRSLSAELKAMQRCIADFQETYGPFLSAAVARSKYWAEFRKDVLRGTTKSVVLATLIGLALASLSVTREWLRSWLR